jgi:AraC-like DNA-binding protein
MRVGGCYRSVLARLDETEGASAIDIALEAGYFDQAHLLRDFRLLAGRSPRRGGARDGSMARHFTRKARLRPLFLAD